MFGFILLNQTRLPGSVMPNLHAIARAPVNTAVLRDHSLAHQAAGVVAAAALRRQVLLVREEVAGVAEGRVEGGRGQVALTNLMMLLEATSTHVILLLQSLINLLLLLHTTATLVVSLYGSEVVLHWLLP